MSTSRAKKPAVFLTYLILRLSYTLSHFVALSVSEKINWGGRGRGGVGGEEGGTCAEKEARPSQSVVGACARRRCSYCKYLRLPCTD